MGLTCRPTDKYKIPSFSDSLPKEHQLAMDPSSAPATSASPATSAAVAPAVDQPPPSSSSSSATVAAATPNPAPLSAPLPNPNPENPQPPPQPAAENPQPSLGRARPLQPPFTHFSPHPPVASSSMASSSSSSSSAPSTMPSTASNVAVQRGMVALGVPATMRLTQPAGGSFSAYGPASFNQPFGGFSRTPATISEVVSNSGSQVVIFEQF